MPEFPGKVRARIEGIIPASSTPVGPPAITTKVSSAFAPLCRAFSARSNASRSADG